MLSCFGLTSYKRDPGASQEPIHHHDVHGRYLGSTQLTVKDNSFNSIHPSLYAENIPVTNLFGFEFIATFLIVLTYFSVTEKVHESSRARLGNDRSRNGKIHRTIIIPFEGKSFRCHSRQGRVNETQAEEGKKNQTREERRSKREKKRRQEEKIMIIVPTFVPAVVALAVICWREDRNCAEEEVKRKER